MAKQKRYDLDFKIQAVKLAREIGINKAARELGIAASTLNGWNMAARQGKIDLGPDSKTPQEAMSLVEELNTLRKQNKELARENKRLKEENDILADATAFFAASRRKSTKTND